MLEGQVTTAAPSAGRTHFGNGMDIVIRVGIVLLGAVLVAVTCVPIIWIQRGEADAVEKLVFLGLAFPFSVLYLVRSSGFGFRGSMLVATLLFTGLSWMYALVPSVPVEVTVAACCFVTGTVLGLSKTSRRPLKSRPRQWVLVAAASALIFGVACGLATGNWLFGARVICATIIGVPSGVAIGARAGGRMHRWLATLRVVWNTAVRMGPALSGFILGYLSLTLVFAAIYGMVYSRNHAAFSGLPDSPGMLDFYYFSIVTASTVGYGDIQPRSYTAKSLVCLEILLGVGWTLVVFSILFHITVEHLGKRQRTRLDLGASGDSPE